MCGIFGVVSNQVNIKDFEASLNSLIHRGPDDFGVYEYQNVFLGHRRLSILDLMSHARQPMESKCGRYVISFNGEIYNFQELKLKLDVKLVTSSDTEVLVEYVSKFGIQKALQDIHGMFAISLLDKYLNRIIIARDRMGEKPLFYGVQNGDLFFSSELKPILKYPLFKKKISKQALRDFFAYNYIPAPLSIIEGVFKAMPGEYIVFDLTKKEVVDKKLYWDREDIIKNKKIRTSPLSENVDHLDNLLKKVVERQMISDVPLGAFLSGGVDSSLIVSIMKEVSSSPIKTFTIGFNEKQYNEAEHAKKVAEHLGTDHVTMYVSPKDILNIVPSLAHTFDEPMSDSSQLPTMLVSKLIKDHVTVALSGDGGDELFGGYNRYFLSPSIFNKFNSLPNFSKRIIEKSIKAVKPSTWDRFSPISGDRLHKLANVLSSSSEFEIYNRLITHWADVSPVLENINYTKFNFDENLKTYEENMMFLDGKTYMPDDILVKVDRSAMAVSLETRAPFLDHEVYDFAWQLPLSHKIKPGNGKIILKELLYKYVPRNLIDRPKMGFGVPLENWLRNELREWAEDLLSVPKLSRSGLLNVNVIRQKWLEHLGGARNWQYYLWDVIVFQFWYDEYMDSFEG